MQALRFKHDVTKATSIPLYTTLECGIIIPQYAPCNIHHYLAVSLQSHTAEDRVRSKAGPSDICGRQSGNGRGISASTWVFPFDSHSNSASY